MSTLKTIGDAIIMAVFYVPSVILMWVLGAIQEYEDQVTYGVILIMAIGLLAGVGRIGFAVCMGY